MRHLNILQANIEYHNHTSNIITFHSIIKQHVFIFYNIWCNNWFDQSYVMYSNSLVNFQSIILIHTNLYNSSVIPQNIYKINCHSSVGSILMSRWLLLIRVLIGNWRNIKKTLKYLYIQNVVGFVNLFTIIVINIIILILCATSI